MIDTAKVRAEHIIMDRWGGPGTGRDEGGICSECEQFWGPQCSDLDWCDALDEANAEIARLTVMTDEMRRGLENHREWAQIAAARYRQNYKDLSSKSESAYRAVTAERALDAANVKMTALLNMVPRYAYIYEDDRLVVLHDDMCAVLNGAEA